MNHDNYDRMILKQLTRIANSLEKIEKEIKNNSVEINYISNEEECDDSQENSTL